MIVGNHSETEALSTTIYQKLGGPFPNINAPFTMPFTAPFDGYLASVSAHVGSGVSTAELLTLQGVSVTPFIIATVTAMMPSTRVGMLTGTTQQIAVGFVNGPGSPPDFGQIWIYQTGPSLTTQADLWADFEPAPVPGPPDQIALTATAIANGWRVFYNSLTLEPSNPQVVSAVKIQRSSDGGSTWTTINTSSTTIGQFDDTTQPSGALRYRALNSNTQGDSAPGPVFICAVPLAPGAPTLLPVSMTSWTVTWIQGAGGPLSDVQRSTDGGSTWSTVASNVTGSTFTDTGVPAGPLSYRIVSKNTVGSTTGAATPATAPGAPSAPVLSETLT